MDMDELKNLDDHTLKKLTEYLTQFISSERLQRIDAVIEQRTRCINIVLEDLYQPHNAGAVMRSCDAFGIQDLNVIEQEHRFKPSAGIALGAEKWLTVNRYSGNGALEECFKKLKGEGYLLIATSPDQSSPDISEIPVDQKISLIFGAELTGLSEKALDMADVKCKIPMMGFTESFNISVSAAICMYELTNRLRNSGFQWRLSDEEKLILRYLWLKKTIRAGEKLVDKYLNGF
jgi:tRNA (guanosine-2'-O-)-methyltransferase